MGTRRLGLEKHVRGTGELCFYRWRSLVLFMAVGNARCKNTGGRVGLGGPRPSIRSVPERAGRESLVGGSWERGPGGWEGSSGSILANSAGLRVRALDNGNLRVDGFFCKRGRDRSLW